ncbi:hypothetical protein [Alkalihalobacterium alkalinitrilicum]|uniref:hypothetical protein n=1 Tax=Alkalihalobacterium alkalinitrilicum TaxID=427920 RepID=UPI000994BB0D|nr:hypothetical protein [Alkalihalobacterium alkalinitrilicum]
MTNYYQLCCDHRGKVVTIYDKGGRQFYGRIVNVDHQYVYIETRQRSTSLGGFSYGYYGGGYYPYRYGHGFGYGIVPVALAAIGGFILGSAIFWW